MELLLLLVAIVDVTLEMSFGAEAHVTARVCAFVVLIVVSLMMSAKVVSGYVNKI